MFGSASKTKKRSCGFSVEPMSLRRVLEPISAAEPREAPAGDVVDAARDGFLHAHASPLRRRSRAAADAGRSPVASAGVSDDSGVPRRRRDELGLAHTGWTRSGAFEPVSSTTQPERATRSTMSMSNGSRRRVAAGDGPVEQAQRLGRQLAEHPPRAARAASASAISPFTSSSACSVVACVGPRRGDLIANRPAERAGQVARRGAPFARVRRRPSARHATAVRRRFAARAAGGAAAPPAAGGCTLHSPVIEPIASANCSAVSRRTSGPAKT